MLARYIHDDSRARAMHTRIDLKPETFRCCFSSEWTYTSPAICLPHRLKISRRAKGRTPWGSSGKGSGSDFIYRVADEYANYNLFDVESNDGLHTLLSGLPLFPYMELQVTPLAKHPSSIR
jgi:muconolactone delta-isomerase